MTAKLLLKSCATPPAQGPIASSVRACRSSASNRLSSVIAYSNAIALEYAITVMSLSRTRRTHTGTRAHG